MLRIRHCLEDLDFVSRLAQQLYLSNVLALDRILLFLTHVIDLLMDDRMLSLHGLLDAPGLLHLD